MVREGKGKGKGGCGIWVKGYGFCAKYPCFYINTDYIIFFSSMRGIAKKLKRVV